MLKSYKLIIKSIFLLVLSLIIVNILRVNSKADNLYEYYFIPDDYNTENEIVSEYDNFFGTLPDEIREQFPDDLFSDDKDITEKSAEIINFDKIWKKIISTIAELAFPAIRSGIIIIGIIVIAAVFRQFKNNTDSGKSNILTDGIINGALLISVINTDLISIGSAENFRSLICNIMNGIVPVFGIVYTSSGNVSTSAIQSGGILLLVTICQNLFTMILMPSVRICLIMSIANAIFPESGIKSVSSCFKSISIGIISVSVTLFSFVLGMQNTVAQTADNFSLKSIKFIVGNLLPIIGGPVSDSLGTVGGSLSVLKNAGGTITIVIIITLLLPVLCRLILNTFTLFLLKSAAGLLGSEAEENLLGDLCSVNSIMLSFAVAISITFIYALTLFTRSTLAINA